MSTHFSEHLPGMPPISSCGLVGPDFIERLASPGWVVVDDALEQSTLNALLLQAKKLGKSGRFRPAKVGKGTLKRRLPTVRSDKIHWIDNWNAHPALSAYLAVLEQVQIQIKFDFRIPIKRFESLFACYPPGAFYKKHVDRHRLEPHRIISCVLYLNEDPIGESGELVLYPKGSPIATIHPKAGRFVCFRSELLHEVKVSQFDRYSIATWFRDDLIAW